MVRIRPLHELKASDVAWAGSKAVRLAQLGGAGFRVPGGLVIGADAYQRYVETTGLLHAIHTMVYRKKFEDMRWEEVWDLSLRVRNRFVRTPIPKALANELQAAIEADFAQTAAVVRSAALHEDSSTASFAGLHDSFINVRGCGAILEKIVLVWASLWSDRALLYHQELSLNPLCSRIAVVIQEFVEGTTSGVAFSQSPADSAEILIEGVWGLNAAMVDGTVPPHRWHVDRRDGHIKQSVSSSQSHALQAVEPEPSLVPLDAAKQASPPLGDNALHELVVVLRRVEKLFQSPQDVEWTHTANGFVLLQSRPITAVKNQAADEKRRWYLTLHRSIDNLKALRTKIQDEILPGMDREAGALEEIDLQALGDAPLAEEIRRRLAIRDRWIHAYWQDCIPFAHGMRLFGQIYNDRCAPADPFEFVELLEHNDLLGAQRNQEMAQLSRRLRELRRQGSEPTEFDQALDAFLLRYGLTTVIGRPQERDAFVELLARLPPHTEHAVDRHLQLEKRFLDSFEGDQRRFMKDLLALARDSYRLRDNDNIVLGRVEAQVVNALREATTRVAASPAPNLAQRSVTELIHLLEDPAVVALTNDRSHAHDQGNAPIQLRARQLVGQPASVGLAVGKARVILDSRDLLSFQEGEILVCDAIDPNLTFVAAMAAGVVERRGGMLIHGAIIAREYRIPCVTGVPDATRWIQTGDTITVDGHLGIVTVTRQRNAAGS